MYMPLEYGTPAEWLEYAQADLTIARIPLPDGAFPQQLCFFAQQAAEKAVKAVLIHCGIEFPKTHNIAALVALLPTRFPRTAELEAATILTAHATFLRYPFDDRTVDEARLRKAVRLAEGVVAWAAEVIGVDASDPSGGGEAP